MHVPQIKIICMLMECKFSRVSLYSTSYLTPSAPTPKKTPRIWANPITALARIGWAWPTHGYATGRAYLHRAEPSHMYQERSTSEGHKVEQDRCRTSSFSRTSRCRAAISSTSIVQKIRDLTSAVTSMNFPHHRHNKCPVYTGPGA